MEKLNAFLRNNVSSIAIGLSVIGIIAHLLVGVVGYARYYTVVSLGDPLKSVLIGFFKSPLDYNLLSILFLVMLGVGGWHYRKSKGLDSRLLRFCFSIIAINKLFSIIILPVRYIQLEAFKLSRPEFESPDQELLNYIIPFVTSMVFVYVTIYLTRVLTKQGQLDILELYDGGEQKFNSYDEVPNSTRLIHLVFDLYIMAMIIMPIGGLIAFYIAIFKDQNIKTFLDFEGSEVLMSLGFSVLVIGYYLLFEGLFQATPAKFLTGTRVVSSVNLRKPTFGKVVLRSISRRIPFESFSFLWYGRWHDTLSKTTVIKEKPEGWVNFNHWIWIILLIVQYIAMFGYSMVSN